MMANNELQEVEWTVVKCRGEHKCSAILQDPNPTLGEGKGWEPKIPSEKPAQVLTGARADVLDQRIQRTDNLSSLVGAPIKLVSKQPFTPVQTSSLLKDKIGEGLYLRTHRSEAASTSPGIVETQQSIADLDLCDAGEWPSMGEGRAPQSQLSSWSSAVKNPPPLQVVHQGGKEEELLVIEENKSDGEEEVIGKKKKKKEKSERAPLVLELADIFQNLEEKKVANKKAKKVVVATGGGVALFQQPPPPKIAPADVKLRSGNILDSSAPALRRGKERETPKKKRPSALRKVITKEKADRKQDLGRVAVVEETGQSELKKVLVEGSQQASELQVIPAATPTSEQVSRPTATPTSEQVSQPTATPTSEQDSWQMISRSTTHKSVHNRRFREYCSHVITEEINECVEKLLTDLRNFQDRQHLRDPTKSKIKRRYVCGLKEVLKHLKLKKLKCVIVPPNLDRIQSEGGIDDLVAQIVESCKELEVPVVFAMSRRRLAVLLRKKHRIGCVGIFYYDGAEAHYKKLMELVSSAEVDYQDKVSHLMHVQHYLGDCGDDGKDRDQYSRTDRGKMGHYSGTEHNQYSGTDHSQYNGTDHSQYSGTAHNQYSEMDCGQYGRMDFGYGGMYKSETATVTELNTTALEFVPTGSLNVNAAIFTPSFMVRE